MKEKPIIDETTQEVEDITIEEENPEVTFGGKKKKDADKVQKLQDEKQEYLDGWQRARAEMANLKKVHAEEKLLFTTLGKQSLLEELVPMLDNFDAAFKYKDAWEEVPETWRIGVEYIYKQFVETLESNAVSVFGEVGDEFNSETYEPVEMIAGDEKDKNKVTKVLQKGYKIGDKVIRPARVHVGE